MPFSFFTITLHFCTSDMVEGLFPQMWANCGIFVEQSQSFHRFSARWKNCCKRGNLSTKKQSLQTVEQVNGTGRWIALRGAAPLLALSAPHCRTRWLDSTMLRIVLCCAVISSTSQNKKRTSYEMRCFFKMVVGDGLHCGGLRPLALSAPHCRTRWFDATMLRIVLCCAVISQPVKIKKAPQTRCFIFSTGGGRWIRTIEVSDSRFTVCPL